MNYIYTLTDPTDNEIKYIGLTTKKLKSRLKGHMRPSNLKESWTSKNKWILWLKNNGYEPIIEILDECENENDLPNLEMYWVSQFKTWGYKLKNETIGGDRGADWNGKKHKPESVEKMKMNHPFRKIIQQFDIKNDSLVGEYLSSYDAAEKTGLQRGHISKCCRGLDNYNSVGGYYFRYKNNYFPYEKPSNSPCKIIQYDLNHNFIKEYKSYYECKKNGFHNEGISNSINNKLPYKNFYWNIKK